MTKPQARLQLDPRKIPGSLTQKVRQDTVRPVADKIPLQDITQAQAEQAVASYDWEAHDYIPNVDFETYKACMTNLEGFQALFSDLSGIPANQYPQVLAVVAALTTNPNMSQEEYVGRLGQLAEIVGNEQMIQCIDAIKSYEYDQKVAASNGAAATGTDLVPTNGNGHDGRPDGSGTPPINGNGNGQQPQQVGMISKLLAPWYSKVILVGVVGGLGYYGYSRFFGKKEDDTPLLDLDSPEEDEEEMNIESVVPNPFRSKPIKLNPKRKRKKRRKKKK